MAIVSTLKYFGSQLRTTASNLHRGIPGEGSLRAGIKEKAGLLRKAGLKAVVQEAGRTAVNMLDRGVSLLLNRQYEETVRAARWQRADLELAYPLLKYLPEVVAGEIGRYLPPISTPLTVRDKKNGFTCYQVPITEANRKIVEESRALVAATLGEYGYEGWSNDIDRSYDNQSFYFIVTNEQNEIIATSRMVRKTEGKPIPFENAFRTKGGQYKLNDAINAVDINSFYNRRKNRLALYSLFAAMGKYAWLIGADQAFCICDRNNTYISTLYQKAGFRFSREFTEQIFFPTFGSTLAGQFTPTPWSIMHMSKLMIFFHGLRALKFIVE